MDDRAIETADYHRALASIAHRPSHFRRAGGLIMAEDPIKAILHYAQALEAPHIIRDSAARLAEQARDDN